jgi:hypothetical protein
MRPPEVELTGEEYDGGSLVRLQLTVGEQML